MATDSAKVWIICYCSISYQPNGEEAHWSMTSGRLSVIADAGALKMARAGRVESVVPVAWLPTSWDRKPFWWCPKALPSNPPLPLLLAEDGPKGFELVLWACKVAARCSPYALTSYTWRCTPFNTKFAGQENAFEDAAKEAWQDGSKICANPNPLESYMVQALYCSTLPSCPPQHNEAHSVV